MNTVSSRPAPDHDDNVAALLMLEALVFIHQADITAVHQWISKVPLVEINSTVDRRDAHPVAVITNAGNHTLHNPSRMKHALGYFFEFFIRWPETENIGVGYGFSAESRAHRVANNSADSCCRSAVRVQCRWMIVRFHLETHRACFVELYHAGVVVKDRDTPGLVQFFCCPKDGLLEQIIEVNLLAVDTHINRALERLMDTVLAPGLGEHFQLDVGRLPAEVAVMLLYGLHLDEIEEKVFCLAQSRQGVVVEFANRPVYNLHLIGFEVRTWRLSRIADYHHLDTIVGKYLLAYRCDLLVVYLTQQDILTGGANILSSGPHIRQRRRNRFSDRVGNAALEVDLN